MQKIAIFASGSGSNFQAIINSIENGFITNVSCEILVCDKPNAFVIERANRLGISTLVLNPKDFNSKESYELEILNKLNEKEINFIVLAGYMRLIGSTLLNAYEGRMVNIHPSLLPKYKGKDAIKQAYEANELEYGITVHYVDSGMDTGSIIEQMSLTTDSRDLSYIESEIHKLEHILYPKVIKSLLSEV